MLLPESPKGSGYAGQAVRPASWCQRIFAMKMERQSDFLIEADKPDKVIGGKKSYVSETLSF